MGGTGTPGFAEQPFMVAVRPAHPGDDMAERDMLRPATGVAIPLGELDWRYSTSGGPGGQHANTSQSRADVRFDIAGSPSLSEWARTRLITKLGDTVEAGAAEHRSQAKNKELALDRLAKRLEVALTPERPRRPTRPTLASKRRRLEAKRRQGDQKRRRRDPGDDR